MQQNLSEANSKIHQLRDYRVSQEEIEKKFEVYKTSEISSLLEEDHGYHYRIEPEKTYKLFGDVDPNKETGKHTDWKTFREAHIAFMEEEYGISLTDQNYSYTKNSQKVGSFHWSIPAYNCKALNQKIIMTKFKKDCKELSGYIDTSIYSVHWWRLPNQTVSGKSAHIIETGKLVDQVIDLVETNSENIDEKVMEEEQTKQEENKDNISSEVVPY